MRLWPIFSTETLRDLLAADRSLAVRCQTCGHEAEADLRRLIQDHGTDTAVDRLPFVCSGCGGRQVSVKTA